LLTGLCHLLLQLPFKLRLHVSLLLLLLLLGDCTTSPVGLRLL
jgi:hypothetical protein